MPNTTTVHINQEVPCITVVVITSDVDCDGTGYGFHRVQVPYALMRDAGCARWFAVQTEQMSDYGDVCDVLSLARFLEEFGPRMDPFSRDYWDREGYYKYTDWR